MATARLGWEAEKYKEDVMRGEMKLERGRLAGLPEAASLTNKDVGELTGTSERYIRANAGILGIPRIKIGRQYRYRPSEVGTWLTAQSVGIA